MKKTFKNRRIQKILAAWICVAAIWVTGCGTSVQPIEDLETYIGQIEDISIPKEVQIIGIGEATHGNVELQQLKQEVLEILLEKKQCRVFALEGDFGGCLKVNEYIHGGDGTAEEAVAEIGFGIYQTKEMADMVEWLRAYNASVFEEEQVSFYGFDMQRYDNNKEILLAYLNQVDGTTAEALEKKMEKLTDETVYSQTKEVNKEAAEEMETFLAEMENARENYIANSDEKSYAIAYACAECIWQNAIIQSGEVSYAETRDLYMSDKVNTILALEPGERVLIAGHNGHIQKTSDNLFYTCMGERLARQYGEAYYTIGTDFTEGEVNVIGGNGKQTTVKIHLDNKLKEQAANLEGNVCYIDIAQASVNETLAKLLYEPQAMISIGDSLGRWQMLLPAFYSVKIVPGDNFNGLILLQMVTPTERR